MRKLTAIILVFTFCLSLIYLFVFRDSALYDVVLWVPIFVLIGTALLFTSYWFERLLDSLNIEVEDKIIQGVSLSVPIAVLVLVSITRLGFYIRNWGALLSVFLGIFLSLLVFLLSWSYLTSENKYFKSIFYVVILTTIIFTCYLHIGTWITQSIDIPVLYFRY